MLAIGDTYGQVGSVAATSCSATPSAVCAVSIPSAAAAAIQARRIG